MKGFFQCNGFFNSNVFFFSLVLSERVVLEVFCQKNVFRIFSKFLGKHLCRSLVFNKVAEHLRATVSVLSKSSLMKGLWLARKYPSLRKKCSYSELFWSVFSNIRTEYGEVRSISPYSIRMRKNAHQNTSECGYFSRSGCLRGIC